jgi:DNA mismatch repair protein MutS
MGFHSILFPSADRYGEPNSHQQPDFFNDLKLDRIVAAMTVGREEYKLTDFFRLPLDDVADIAYRHEIMKDLEQSPVVEAMKLFARGMRTVRVQTGRMEKSLHRYERERWYLGAAEAYCAGVERLDRDLAGFDIVSRGLRSFREYLSVYAGSAGFRTLASDTRTVASDLAAIRYNLLIDGGTVTVRPYDGESDYSVAVEGTFEKFRRGAVKEYRAELSSLTGMNHVQEQVLDGLARLYPEAFRALVAFPAEHPGYPDETIFRFDREIQFYLAYLTYIDTFRRAGLPFCYPEISDTSKEIDVRGGFDLALAGRLIGEGAAVVTNDVALRGAERILVVSGANQGGKTTFARAFGQLHYLARLGCPVPGTHARLFLFDRLFTHFERQESVESLRGKLQDDLIRIRAILDRATPNSLIIMNEIFSSTTLRDALVLGSEIMARISALDALAVCVTFLTELASFDAKTVSYVSLVDAHDPSVRTYRVVRRAATGVAHALVIAEKYGLTYERLKDRIRP